MKKLIILCSVLLTAFISNAQSVAINTDGTSAAASAMLDVKSTTKGMLIPRVSSAQRLAIASPVIGLMVFDTDTKTIWAYDGGAWKNLHSSGGFSLPYSQTVNMSNSALQITNQGTGAAIEGASSNDFGIGITAKASGPFGWGLYAVTNRSGANSIYAIADSGTVFHGENNYAGNTNTLMSLLNKGIGKTSTFQLANATSSSANVQIAGNHLGEQLLIFQTNSSNTKPAVSISNSGNGAGVSSATTNGTGILGTSTSGLGISGISSTNYGVKGLVTNSASGVIAGVYGGNTGTAGVGVYGIADFANGAGVYGTSANGTGVAGFSGSLRGVQGTSNSGTALYGSSGTGYGLEVSGKVKISGGNTNPGTGKVLTSDASGNATWQSPVSVPKIAFRAAGIADPTNTDNWIPSSTNVYPYRKKVEFGALGYDFGGVYTLYNGNNTNSSSMFTVPMTGLYHFDAAIKFLYAVTFDYREIEISLMLNRNGTNSELARIGGYINDVDNTQVAISGDFTLLPGDKVYVAARQVNLVSLPSPLVNTIESCYFSGHLVFPF